MHPLVTLRDIFTYSRHAIVPAQPVSLYRYFEHIVEVAVARKFGLKRMLEVGPGIYPAIEHFEPDEFQSVSLADYNTDILDFCEHKFPKIAFEKIEVDIEKKGSISGLGARWDYVVSNGILEHLRADQQHVNELYEVLEPGGIMACVTVLHPRLFNAWDTAVGHHRRYRPRELRRMFDMFSDVQVINTGTIQELVRPFFFSRINHLLANSVDDNNRLFAEEVKQFSKPPYASIFWLLRYLLPLYLVVGWAKRSMFGAIVIIVARK